MNKVNPSSIGRNSPPAEHQFKPGQSGNPLGRPKGSHNIKTIVQKIARERHKVKGGGRTQSVTTIDLLLRLLLQMSLKGDVRASKYIENLRDRYDPSSKKQGLLVVPGEISPEEWIRRQEILNQFLLRH